MGKHANTLVCVTQQRTCERLIIEAARKSRETGGELYVLHVARNGWKFLDSMKEGEALEHLFTVSKSVGADLTVLKSDNIPETIASFSHDNDIGRIVIGASHGDHPENDFSRELKRLLDGVEISVMPPQAL